MKITKNQLSQIIKEELQRVILEQPDGEEEEKETEEIIKWDEHDQDNQDARHIAQYSGLLSPKEAATEWIEDHTRVTGVGTQHAIDLVTLLIDKIKVSGGDDYADEAWEEVSSFFEDIANDDSDIANGDFEEETLYLKTPTRKDIKDLKRKLPQVKRPYPQHRKP